jgi:fluoride exporter
MPARRRASPVHPDRRPRPRHHDEVLPVDPDLSPDDTSEPSLGRARHAHVRRSRQIRVLIAIAAGGCLGALARYEVTLSWATALGHFPWATFTINTSGALFLGVVLTVILSHPHRFSHLRAFLCVGFTGAWTTMSTFALETDLLAKGNHLSMAAIYVAATVVAGLAAASAGIAIGRLAARRAIPWLSR